MTHLEYAFSFGFAFSWYQWLVPCSPSAAKSFESNDGRQKKCPALRDALHVPVFGWVSFDDPLLRHRTIPCQLRLIKCNKFPSLIPCELFPKFPSHLLPKIASRCRVMPGQTQKNQLPPVMVVVPWGTAWQSRPWSDHRRSRRPCSRS